ncbi:hypothetical protein SAY87_016447 [Trapa incisa]|uniref:Uncharacterized protein n=1 Tax=Trapa incisa TaxID=236973 RepID=A0AAN7L6U1_9MYRT|nr:hypothetical protein SAY87_016447 [Trapa incisa]
MKMEMNYEKMGKSRVSKEINRGAWTAEEDRKLAEVIAVHGPKKWKTVAAKAGLNRCGKSCRLRWLNYLRPNIKRGNITDQEEDLILRLHRLLGNRWSLIAGRLPGRTDNEIKNYWNSHLSKKLDPNQKPPRRAARKGGSRRPVEKETQLVESTRREVRDQRTPVTVAAATTSEGDEPSYPSFHCEADDDFFDFSNESALNWEWVSRFIEFNQLHHQA